MKTNQKNSGQKNSGTKKFLVTMIYYLSVILTALVLGLTRQIAGWVEQVVILLSLCRIIYVIAWGAGKNGFGWRV